MNILLAEDQAMVRSALSTLLTLENDFQVTQAADGNEALAQLRLQTFDILLTDIEMPGMSGLELAHWLKQRKSPTKIIIITTFGRAGYIRRALDLQIDGFLLKDSPIEELTHVIKQVMLGKRMISDELAIAALSDDDPLNDKERRSLRLASEGKTTAEIAEILCISMGTVRNYLSNAISKLNATNRADAFRIGHQKGWL